MFMVFMKYCIVFGARMYFSDTMNLLIRKYHRTFKFQNAFMLVPARYPFHLFTHECLYWANFSLNQ